MMKTLSTIIINTLIFLIVLVLIIIAWEKFVPNGGLVGKDLHEIAWAIAEKKELQFDAIRDCEDINPDDIDIPIVQSIKISYRKALSVIGLTMYLSESGISHKLILHSRKGYILIKGFCANDQLIGVEIDYTNIDPQRLNELKTEINNVFYSYDVIWREL